MSSTSGSKKMTSREKHVANFTFFRFPVLLFALCAGIYFALIPTGSWILFSNHPFFMTLGAVGLPINAALVKKIGGYDNTVLHGNLLALAFVLMLGGYAAIYVNKERAGKLHNQTLHSWIGFGVLCAWAGVLLGALFSIHPRYGYFPTKGWIRKGHKWFSRGLILASWAACYTGFATIEKTVVYHVAIAAPVLYAGFYALL